MKVNAESFYIAFAGSKKIAKGSAIDIAKKVKRFLAKNPRSEVLILDAETSTQAEFDFRGSEGDVMKRLADEFARDKPAGPGRPRLGVISREIGLLPTHWEWLALQPGGASATLRKLVDEAKKRNIARDRIRFAQESTYRFMVTLAGDLPHFEEALRSLYSKNQPLFETLTSRWPKDIRDHLKVLSNDAFAEVKEAK